MRSLLLALVLCAPLTAQGVSMRLCQGVRDHGNLMRKDGSGVVDRMLRQAATESGIEVEVYHSANCREDLKRGKAQAFPMAPYIPETLPFVAYPEKQGRPDISRAVMLVRTMLFRRSGGSVAWDGHTLQHQSGGLMTNSGSVRPGLLAHRLGIALDPVSRSAELNFKRLLSVPNTVTAMLEVDGLALMEQRDYAGKIEMLPVPFVEEMYFVVFSQDYYKLNRKYAERFWTALGRLRMSPAYAAPLRDAAPARD